VTKYSWRAAVIAKRMKVKHRAEEGSIEKEARPASKGK